MSQANKEVRIDGLVPPTPQQVIGELYMRIRMLEEALLKLSNDHQALVEKNETGTEK